VTERTPVVVGGPTLPEGLDFFAGRTVVQLSSGWEIPHLIEAFNDPIGLDRFVYLKSSTRILDERFWDVIDAAPAGRTSFLFARPSCYMAIYDRADFPTTLLERPPVIADKEQSIYWEWAIHDYFLPGAIWPDVRDEAAKRIERVDGVDELVIGNDLVEKYKGTVRCGKCSGRARNQQSGLCPHTYERFQQ
jgi:hypothetical protein